MLTRKSARAVAIILLSLVLSIGAIPDPLGDFSATYAYAQDDDGGDDDGDDGGGSSGARSSNSRGDRSNPVFRSFRKAPRLFRNWRWGKAPRRAYVRRAAPRQVRRAAARPSRPAPPREIVAFGATAPQIQQFTTAGFQIVERLQLRPGDGNELLRMTAPRGVGREQALTQARAIAPQAAIDDNHLYSPSDAGDCGGKPCVAPSLVGWPSGQATTCGGAGVTIGLIDTGINVQHPTFAGGQIEVIGLGKEKDASSDHQHGTAVAALLIGRARGATPGLLPDAKLVAVDAFEANSKNPRADAFTLARAIDLLAARNVDVLNLSLAGPDNTVVKRMIDDADARNIVLVAAAGNDGPRAKPVFPAAYPEVIAVTAVDRGKNLYRRAVRGEHIDIAAPGVNVWTAASVSGVRTRTGTSFAAPFVAAAAALAKSSGYRDTKSIEEHLARTASDLGQPGKDASFGWGLLNVSQLCRSP